MESQQLQQKEEFKNQEECKNYPELLFKDFYFGEPLSSIKPVKLCGKIKYKGQSIDIQFKYDQHMLYTFSMTAIQAEQLAIPTSQGIIVVLIINEKGLVIGDTQEDTEIVCTPSDEQFIFEFQDVSDAYTHICDTTSSDSKDSTIPITNEAKISWYGLHWFGFQINDQYQITYRKFIK